MLDDDLPLSYSGDPAELFAALDELIDVRPAWRSHGACVGHPQEWWFPEGPGSTAEAVTICAGCPVRVECLDHALSLGPGAVGIWGGTSERERRKMRGTIAA